MAITFHWRIPYFEYCLTDASVPRKLWQIIGSELIDRPKVDRAQNFR